MSRADQPPRAQAATLGPGHDPALSLRWDVAAEQAIQVAQAADCWHEGWLCWPSTLGFLPMVKQCLSPHHDERPQAVDMVVVHHISLPKNQFGGPFIADLFCGKLDVDADPSFAELQGLRVSAHFLIGRDGELSQYVSCDRRAWHAGVSSWQGRERCNDFSIGIELEGSEDLPFEHAQYQTLRLLMLAIRKQYRVEHCLGHSDIAPGRKIDPGPWFDWHCLLDVCPALRRDVTE